MKVPVLLTVFNRADAALTAFQSIKTYRPDRLYIAADGPRKNKEDEAILCEQTRRAIMEAVDWPCQVKTLFQDVNLGCAKAMYGAISWFLEQEEWGIICEDDVVLSQDFYKLCEELLPMYKDDDRVMQITSQYYGPHRDGANSYSFQRKPFIWGWATWRRSWFKYMDMSMSAWPHFHIRRMIPAYGLFQTFMMWHYWRVAYRHIETISSWATRWHFAAVVNELFCIVPQTNLGINIGVKSGTHYTSDDGNSYMHLKLGTLHLPLQHPAAVQLDVKVPRASQRRALTESNKNN